MIEIKDLCPRKEALLKDKLKELTEENSHNEARLLLTKRLGLDNLHNLYYEIFIERLEQNSLSPENDKLKI